METIMKIRKATIEDLYSVAEIYDEIHTAEEENKQQIGWIRGIYPVQATAEAALQRDDLFVLEDHGKIYGSGIINRIQMDAYSLGHWKYDVPSSAGKGYGRNFLAFYETYATEHGCSELRIDTNEKNMAARAMYRKHGYSEVGIVPTPFNGIPDVQLVLLEKYIGN